MKVNKSRTQSVIENTFVSAIKKLTQGGSGNMISDLYVQAEAESGELQIYDDNENLVEKVIIFDWVNSTQDDAFNKRVIAMVKAVLTVLSSKEMFNHESFLRPLSISLTDDDFVVIEELLFLDDDMFRLDDPLLKDLDADLDDFLNKLLSDVN